MIFSNKKNDCEQAKRHFYDYLYEDKSAIEPEVLAHIENCQKCQSETDRLKRILAGEESANKTCSLKNSAFLINAKLHFNYVEKTVTCGIAKPFLASQADLNLQIRIPTPITVHLDKCQNCADDLGNISRMNLSHKQLTILGRLFAETTVFNEKGCSSAQSFIQSFVNMDFQDINPEIKNHLCLCSECRQKVFECRQEVIKELDNRMQHDFPCEDVLNTDIFDYCFPYAANFLTDQYMKSYSSLISHVIECSACLAKVQQLHNAIDNIIERKESSTATLFNLKDTNCLPNNEIGLRSPIEIQLFEKQESPPINISNEKSTCKNKTVSRLKFNIKPTFKGLAKYVSAAAAIVLIAILLSQVQVAGAINIDQIYKALSKIKNVCIITSTSQSKGMAKIKNAYIINSTPQSHEISQQKWISKELNIKLYKTDTHWILWDINNQCQKSKFLDDKTTTTASLDENQLNKTEDTMESPWGLLPANNPSDLPKDYIWTEIDDTSIKAGPSDTLVYDLIWKESTIMETMIYKKNRYFLDIQTGLPKKIEWWVKHSTGKEYELQQITTVNYPQIAEIQQILKDAGFEQYRLFGKPQR